MDVFDLEKKLFTLLGIIDKNTRKIIHELSVGEFYDYARNEVISRELQIKPIKTNNIAELF